MARLVDTHYHLELASDFREVARELERRAVYTVAVSNVPAVYVKMRSMLQEQKYLRLAVGLHPELAVSHGHQLAQCLDLMKETDYVGEIGLDGSPSFRFGLPIQQQVFTAIVDRARELRGKVLSVHSRRAEAAVLATIGQEFPGTVILHWYSGNLIHARKAVDAGYFFSINSSMLKSSTGRRLIQELPRDRVLTETDGPFISVDNRPAVPWDVGETIHALARLWATPAVNTQQLIWANFRQALTSAAEYRLDSGRRSHLTANRG